MNLVIRHATPDDAPAIARFNVALARETERRTLNRRLVALGVRALLNEPHHGFYVVADNGKKIVGMTMITYEWSDWLNRQWWWLQSVYVDPSLRRSGIFGKIHAYIEELAARADNVCGIRLYAEKDNLPAHRTYRSIGLSPSNYGVFEQLFERKKKGVKSRPSSNRPIT